MPYRITGPIYKNKIVNSYTKTCAFLHLTVYNIRVIIKNMQICKNCVGTAYYLAELIL